MQNKKWIRFVESFILVPVVAMSASLGSIQETKPNVVATPPVVSSQRNNILSGGTLAVKDAMDQKLEDQKAKARAIDAYFMGHDMPLYGMGMKMVLEAEKNEIDWRLLPAIAVRESTGGKNPCDFVKHNSFGWDSCKTGFKSSEQAIEVIARNLGGNNPSTARHYGDKTTEQILRAYNPPSVMPHYTAQVISIMSAIGDKEINSDSIAKA
jgi:hypothetical protein